MNKIFKTITLIIFLVLSVNIASSKENFFDEALKMYQDKKYDDARFLLERNIVFNPKDAKSYLYLAKIYNHEENQRKEEYNLDTALLIEPNNEEVILMLMKIALKKSNYSKVKDLSQTFVKVCEKLCSENTEIQKVHLATDQDLVFYTILKDAADHVLSILMRINIKRVLMMQKNF